MKQIRTFKFILSFYAVLTFISCTDESSSSIFEKELNQIEKRELSSSERTLKSNLSTTATIVRDMILEEKEIINEVDGLIKKEIYNDDIICFKDLFEPQKNERLKSVKISGTKFANKFREKYKSCSHLKSSISIENFLSDNNISIYCPYPLEDYPEGNRIPTITFHPIDNDIQNIGFEPQSDGTYKEVIVNEEYSENKPVWVIFPQEFENDLIDKVEEKLDLKSISSDKVTEIKIGQIYCRDYCSHFFDGKLELRILRSKTAEVLNGDTWKAEGSFDDATPINLKRKYVRYARKGWSKGWRTVNVIWDSNWKSDKTQQVFAVYEEDPTGEIEVNGTAKYTAKADVKDDKGKTISAGKEVSLGCKGKFKSRNDILGVKEWDRNWFFKTNKLDNGNRYRGSYHRDGWAIRASCPDFWFTIPVREL